MDLPVFQRLSKEQLAILNLPLDGSFLVGGPPGTGKTVMAVYRARMLNESGRAVRLMMRSKLLKHYTSSAADALNIQAVCTTYHSWTWKFYKNNYGNDVPQTAPYVFDWKAIQHKVFQKRPQKDVITHIIIDEGQDLPEQFYESLTLAICSNVTVLADENQRITDTNTQFEKIAESTGVAKEHIYFLRKNYRNTRQIAELAEHFYIGTPVGKADPPDREGPLPEVIRTSARTAEQDPTAEFIARYARTNATHTVGVLVPNKDLLFHLNRTIKRSGDGASRDPLSVEYYVSQGGKTPPKIDITSPGVKLVCFESAKGLEFDTVFLPYLDQFSYSLSSPNTKMLLYVLLSRARDNLYLMYSGETLPLAEMLPKHLLDWRDL